MAQEARMVAASLHEQGIGPETREYISQNISTARENIRPVLNQVTPVVGDVLEEVKTNIPDASNVLRQIEQNKLLGVPVTQ